MLALAMRSPCLKILVVDDEPTMREVLRARLESWGFEVALAATAAEARGLAARLDPSIVVSDVVLPDARGVELLDSLGSDGRPRPVILITAYGSVDVAVEAMKRGARDFLTKPLDYPKLRAAIEDLCREAKQREEARRLAARLARGAGLGRLLGTSPAMRETLDLIRLVAGSEASAVLTGESGTGKELAGHTIHELGARREGPFVAVNSAAIAEGLTESELFGHERGAFTGAVAMRAGLFEQADRGTLFLDEIAEMPAALQPKLLRAIEHGQVRRVGGSREIAFDVRVIAATNRDPVQAVRDGRLREDLFYRLNVFTVRLPALRERREDIPLLAQHFVRLFNDKHGAAVEGLSGETLELMRAFGWPGNVRELRNVIERGVILAKEGWLEPFHLPPYLRGTLTEASQRIVLPAGVTAAEAERIVLLETLERVGHNKAEAARRLGLDVKTIRNRLKAYGLDGEDR